MDDICNFIPLKVYKSNTNYYHFVYETNLRRLSQPFVRSNLYICLVFRDSTFTAHTTNLVPLILVGDNKELKEGRLCDLAPTMLELMGIEKPQEMTGESLIK